jgi:threonylcarbamoyladenosine tRNA methylthiotransferase MtaB
VEPGDVTEEFLEVTADLDAFCRHLHVPLQSGSDRTLARMRRPYDTAAFTAMLQRVEDRLPGVAVTTDVIVGFPGETDADAAESLAFVRDSSFARLHVFRYSPRAGTDAAGLPGRVPPPIAAERAAAMRACGEDLQRAWPAARMGATAEVLIERASSRPDGTIHAEGTTREYERVRFPVPSERTGALAIVTLGAREDDGVVTASPARPGSMSVVESGR